MLVTLAARTRIASVRCISKLISMFLKTLRDFGFSSVSDSVAYLAVCFEQFVNEEREPKEDERDAL